MNWTSDVALWLMAALLLFWCVGAYGRLQRLRTAALRAWAQLDAALARQLEFVQTRLAAVPTAHGDKLGPAADQLAVLLAATRARPLSAMNMAALSTALRILLALWQRTYPEEVVHFDSDGLLSRPAPLVAASVAAAQPTASSGPAPFTWPEPSAAAELARSQFNSCVAAYNHAVGQFPALLLAWLLRMRPAAPLA